jgi:tRNA 2-thiouridine synthesizing protein B
MSTLFVIHRSPYSAPEMNSVLRLAKPGDGVIVTQDAVLALRSTQKENSINKASGRGIKFYAVKADIDARSVRPLRSVKLIDYDDLVELLSQYESTFS